MLLPANAGLAAGLSVFFLVILPLLVLGIICGYRRRDKLQAIWTSTRTQIQSATRRFVAEFIFVNHAPRCL